MIEIKNLGKSYGDTVALRDLNLSLKPGEVFAFLGPNGAGKTTTIKILTGLVRPNTGSVTIGGFDIIEQPLLAKALMSYVPDEPYLYEKLSAREFLNLIGDLYGLEKERREQRLAEMVKIFELESFLDNLCESFSHGMKQRVVLAGALLHQPKVLILDEPMVGLDPKSARNLKNLIRKLANEEGLTVFMSTHTLSIAEEVADRIAILSKGNLAALGTFKELLELRHAKGEEQENFRLEDLFLELTDGTAMRPAN